MVGAPGFEPGTSCAQGRSKNTILLILRLSSLLLLARFSRFSDLVGPKLDPSRTVEFRKLTSRMDWLRR